MKKWHKLVLWVIIAIVFHIGVLTYLDQIYLVKTNKAELTVFENESKPRVDKEIRIPRDAKMIKTSGDGAYAGYIQHKILKVAHMDKGKTVKIIGKDEGEVSYYRWVPGKQIIIFAVKSVTGTKTKFRIKTYDMQSQLGGEYPVIEDVPQDSSIEDITLSSLTNVVYVKVRVSKSHIRVYKLDIAQTVMPVLEIAGDVLIKQANYFDKLLYQADSREVLLRDGSTNEEYCVFKGKNIELINIDADDNVYIGEFDGNRLLKLYVGQILAKGDIIWENRAIDTLVPKSEMHITSNGEIYSVLEGENEVVNADLSKRTEYMGILVDILDHYVVSIRERILKLTVLSQDD